MFFWGEHGVVPLVPFFLDCVLGVDGHAVLCLHAVFPSRQTHQFVLVFPPQVIDLCLLAAQLYCFVFELFVEKCQFSLFGVDILLCFYVSCVHFLDAGLEFEQVFVTLS